MTFRIIALFLTLMLPAGAFAQDTVVPETRQQVTLSFAPVVKKAAPAVVNIYTKKKIRVRSFSPFMNDPFFKEFFGEELLGNGRSMERIQSSLGSGVLVGSDGLIVTNHHVIKESDEITVSLADKREFSAKIVMVDERTDLALLKIDTSGEHLPFLEFYDSDKMEVGDLVLAIGNPFGVGQTVTSGIISAPARTTLGVSDYQFFIQTDAPINPGNSGGALVNMEGKLVGINTAIYSRSGGSNGIGFATPSNMVHTILKNISAEGKLVRPWLGASMQNVTQEIATSLGMKRPIGALLSKIYKGGPADKAGLKEGDVIIAAEGFEVADPYALQYRISTLELGKAFDFTIFREGKEFTKKLTISAPPEMPKRDARKLQGAHILQGATIANLSPALADELSVNLHESGVIIIGLVARTAAVQLGFKPKDIILSVNDEKVTSTAQLEKMLTTSITDETVKGWHVQAKRNGQVINIIVGKR